MSSGQIAVFAVAALLVFWMVGAYNRLTALRGAIVAAWAVVADALARRGEAARALADALGEPLAGEAQALDALRDAERQVRAAADALAARPLRVDAALAFVRSEAAMAAASARVLALLAQLPTGAVDEATAANAALLGDSGSRLAFARQLFNEAAAAYEAAAGEFPTRLLRRLYRFGAAGRL